LASVEVRWLRGVVLLVVVLALLGGGLYLGDQYAEKRAETEAAVELQRQLGTPQQPAVDIEGSPFLTQLAARSIRSVHVVADDMNATSDVLLPIGHADLVLSDVTTTDWYASMTVSHAEGTARIDYSALEKLAKVPLSYVGSGRVKVETTATIVGRKVTAQITGSPRLDVEDQTITLGDPDVTVAGVNLPGFTAAALLRALLKPIKISGVPLDLRLTSIDPQDGGINATVIGDSIPIKR
jgi:LmeA-like phospholipid-binding